MNIFGINITVSNNNERSAQFVHIRPDGILHWMVHFHSIQKEDIIRKYKLSAYTEQGLQSQEPKHATKTLAINTSFDPGEW